MRKTTFPLVLILLLMGSVLSADDIGKVLLLMQEKTDRIGFMIRNEVKPMIKMLNEAGYQVEIATETGQKIGYGDVITIPDLKFDQVTVDNYKGIIIPCMAVMETKDTIPRTAVELVSKAFEKGLPIAAQNSGVTFLGQAKVVSGKKYAIGEERFISLMVGGTYQGNGVVRDGKLVTSGICPWLAGEGKGKDGTAELTKTFILMLQEYEK